MNSDIVSLIIILICVMLSAYFSATETSFTSLNRIRMKKNLRRRSPNFPHRFSTF